MSDRGTQLRFVALGTYDKGKPRIRILLRGLRENGVEVIECHRDVWGGIEDKSQVRGAGQTFALAWKLLSAYPILIWRYLRMPKHDVVLIGYLGLFDVLVLWPFVRLRRAFLVWDVFLSLYNTVVEDRSIVTKRNPVSGVLWIMEWFALRLVDLALMDTQAHSDYLSKTYVLDPTRIARVFVGVEREKFDLAAHGLSPANVDESPKRVLFYGQFIPLHGIETVVRAAKLTENENLRWRLIGTGQEASKIRNLVDELQPTNLEWINWVDYEDLVKYLADCHVALGVFGTTDKAQRVIPNKVFQILAAGRPLVTGDTPAAHELLDNVKCVSLVAVGAPRALADAVLKTVAEGHANDCGGSDRLRRISPSRIGADLLDTISEHLHYGQPS